jgi:ABC-type branched-subunit amino acid transport system substrate-binding protein
MGIRHLLSAFLCLTVFVLLAVPVWAQTPLKNDSKTEAAYLQAEKLFTAEQYAICLNQVNDALTRPPSTLTDACMYLKGLTLYKLKRYEDAMTAFNMMLKEYPKSLYEEECRYHKGIILCENEEKRDAGLFLLMNIAEQSKNPALKQDAQRAVLHFLFDVFPIDFLASYHTACRPTYRDVVLEAWCMKLYKAGAYLVVDGLLKDRGTTGKPLTPNMLALQKKLGIAPPVNVTTTVEGSQEAFEAPFRGDTLRLSVLMPFQFNSADSLRMVEGTMSMEMLEGLQLATDSLVLPEGPRWVVQVHAYPKGSEPALRALLDTKVDPFKPHIILGGLYRAECQTIASFAERRKIPYLIPFSANNELTAGRKYTFTLAPSFERQGKALASAATDTLHLKRFFVISDSTPASEQLCNAFMQGTMAAKASASKVTLPTTKRGAINMLSNLFQRINSAGSCGVFFPTADEPMVTYLLENLRLDSAEATVFGTLDYRNFNAIPLQLLFKARPVFADHYGYRSDTIMNADFRKSYLHRFGTLPTIFAAQGYDAGRLIAWAARRQGPTSSLRQRLLNMPDLQGLNQHIQFSGAQVNQRVQIYRLQNDLMLSLAESLNNQPHPHQHNDSHSSPRR